MNVLLQEAFKHSIVEFKSANLINPGKNSYLIFILLDIFSIYTTPSLPIPLNSGCPLVCLIGPPYKNIVSI